ncbi:MAG TPA: tetratricopeptide repeat protein [Anaerolineae bacterium]|nr:tetratricopeptide repeat protein [Anaerolineae bacterium]
MTLSEHIIDVTEATFESDVLLSSHDVPVVADFWATWCGPCLVLGPILERLAIEAGGAFRLAKVNVDENPNLAIRYGVQGIPAVKAFKNGKVEAEFVGAQPEPVLRRFVQRLVPTESEQAVEKAQSLLATRHWKEAEQAFRDVLDENDTNSIAALGLMKSLLMQGQGEEPRKIIENFPPGTEWAEAERLRPLAEILAEVEEDGPYPSDDPLAARFYQAARLISRNNFPAAMDGLLDILREDKEYRGGLPKQILLALFALLGDGDPLTRQYRDELASILF